MMATVATVVISAITNMILVHVVWIILSVCHYAKMSVGFIVFNISAALKDEDGVLCPFNIISSIEYETLCDLLAKKMGRFPKNLKLRYHLDIDKSSASAISIQLPAELDIFKEHMRTMLVPQRLTNGKISKRAPKQVTVYFEDATGSSSGWNGSAKSNNTGKQVCFFFCLWFWC